MTAPEPSDLRGAHLRARHVPERPLTFRNMPGGRRYGHHVDKRLSPTILFVGAGVSQRAAIVQGRARRLQIVAVAGDERAVGLPEADRAEVVEILDLEAVIETGSEALSRPEHAAALVPVENDRDDSSEGD